MADYLTLQDFQEFEDGEVVELRMAYDREMRVFYTHCLPFVSVGSFKSGTGQESPFQIRVRKGRRDKWVDAKGTSVTGPADLVGWNGPMEIVSV